MIMGVYEVDWGKKKTGVIPSNTHDRSQFSQEKYKFFLDAPFEIAADCCKVMKKKPVKEYNHKNNRHPMTAQMAAESRLRLQKWIQNGCNAFDLKEPISNPMSFWTENDVLEYVKTYDLPIASVYGEVVKDYGSEIDGQINLEDYGLVEGNYPLKTTKCTRTGCIFCGYGCHLEKGIGRFAMIDEVSNPNLRDYVMRGGSWKDGLWKPTDRGMGYWFVMKWINIAGGFDMNIPEYERYEREYGDERTAIELKRAEEVRRECTNA